MVKRLIVYISILVPLIGASQTYTVDKLPYSGGGDMYAPSYFQDHLVVCSNKKHRINRTLIDLSDKEPINLFVISSSHGDSITIFEPSMRTAYNDGPISFNEHGTDFVVSRNLKASLKSKKK